jgi:predicted GNAT superfamily acetyltransferase
MALARLVITWRGQPRNLAAAAPLSSASRKRWEAAPLTGELLEAGAARAGFPLAPARKRIASVEAPRVNAVRPVASEDLPALLALNNAHSVEMGRLDLEKLREHLGAAALATAIGPIAQPDAFLLAFDHDTPRQGPNHAWFLARRARFLYVDRVCVHPRARRQGLARALYSHALEEAVRRGLPILCCEVNSDPPNPVSDAFHASLGFVEVGRAFLPDRGKSVHYLERQV